MGHSPLGKPELLSSYKAPEMFMGWGLGKQMVYRPCMEGRT